MTNRNNAKFPLEVVSFLESIKQDQRFLFLKSYQNLVREYYKKYINDEKALRGLLVYHGMGLGKSITAACLGVEQAYPVIFLMSKSLVANMRKNIAEYLKWRVEAAEQDFKLTSLGIEFSRTELLNDPDKYIDHKFRFVSFNASNMKDQIYKILRRRNLSGIKGDNDPISLNGYLLIVDEAHNLFRSIVNGSLNGTTVFDLMQKSRNARAVFLTGTPINNHPFELSACFNMLDPGCMPDSFYDFNMHFIAKDKLKNEGKFQNRIFGLVSFVDNSGLPGLPHKLPTKVCIIPMANDQYSKYKLARELEMQEGQQTGRGKAKSPGGPKDVPSMQKPSSGSVSSYRSKSRQLSNYAPPGALGEVKELNAIDNSAVKSNKFDAIYEDIERYGLSIVYSQYTGLGGIGAFAKYLMAHGWREFMDHNTNFDLAEKIEGGAVTPEDYVNAEVKSSYVGSNQPANGKHYAVISGAVSFDDRKEIEKHANKMNTKVDLVLVSSTGAEGLNFERRRFVGIMEPYWNYARIAQVAARAIRTDSHAELPEDQRNVQIGIYLSVAPDVKKEVLLWDTEELEKEAKNDTTTKKLEQRLKDFGGKDYGETDISLIADSISDYRAIMSFLRAMQNVSIECKIRGHSNACRVCAPNDTPLFSANIARDIVADDPCREYTSARVKAKAIEHDGIKYHYVRHTDGKVELYKFDPRLNAHREVKKNEDVYFELLPKLK